MNLGIPCAGFSESLGHLYVEVDISTCRIGPEFVLNLYSMPHSEHEVDHGQRLTFGYLLVFCSCITRRDTDALSRSHWHQGIEEYKISWPLVATLQGQYFNGSAEDHGME